MTDAIRLTAFLAGMVVGHAVALWHLYHENWPAATFFLILGCYMDWSFHQVYGEMTKARGHIDGD